LRQITDKNSFFSDQAVNFGSLDWFQAQIYGQELLFLGIGGKFQKHENLLSGNPIAEYQQ
jgi:hypothetical protein